MNNSEQKYENNNWINVYGNNESNIGIDTLRNDNENWMKINENELNDLLNEYGYNNNKKQQMLFEEMLDDNENINDFDNTQTKDDILSLKESLNSFMDEKSGVNGVEMDGFDNELGIESDGT